MSFKKILTLLLVLYGGLCLSAQSALNWQVVISEMMVDPTPKVALPELEYIELYNRSDSNICLNGWTIRVGSKIGKINNDTLPPHSFALLCSHTRVDSLSPYGKTIGVTSWPALNNEGCTPALFDSIGLPVAWASYNPQWIDDDAKTDGGWSWECIDIDNIGETKANWHISTATQGGTPGQRNAVANTRIDTVTPKISAIFIPNDTTLSIQFNKHMLADNIEDINNFSVSNHTIANIVANSINDQTTITLLTPTTQEEQLTLNMVNLRCNSGFYMADTTIQIYTPSPINPHDIVINEIMYQSSTQPEWVEVYNISQHAILLNELYIATSNSYEKYGKRKQLCEQALTLQPQQYAVVSKNTNKIDTRYNIPNDVAQLDCQLGSLPDEGGCIALTTTDSTIIDEVCYSPKWHHEAIANTYDVSLEKINADDEGNNSNNWQSASATEGYATPGRRNSATRNETTDEQWFTLEHDTFSPNADNYHDELIIHYSLPYDGFVANITVYDPQGHLCHTIAKQTLLATQGDIKWNGQHNGTPITTGIYVVLIEAFHTNGQHITKKLVCVRN
ncbi:MAG: lamin tail domain-containing protein [Bacteroidales bacterium]|nr:lamin tail domain-containing protein [Bacteroidales bacterium]